jgi:transposase InsO family protein
MSLLAIKERGLSARDELGKTYGALRDLVAERVNDVDTAALRKQGRALKDQGIDLAGTVRERAMRQLGRLPVAPKPKRRFPVVPVVVTGVALVGVAAAVWFLYDQRRRQMVRDRVNQVGSAARDRYVQLGGVNGAVETVRSRIQKVAPTNGTDLEAKVVEAIADTGEMPRGLQVEVEGRTVYLKGEVIDPTAADAAAEKAHSVQGVVAVVNHTTAATR